MNVSEFVAQESRLAQLASQENTLRSLDWQNNLFRQEQLLWNAQQRAALCTSEILRTVEMVRSRPFDDLISRMEEQSRGFQRLTEDLTRSAISNAALESIKIGEVYRKLIEPIPALKTVLQPPIEPFFSTVFESARAVKPLVELQQRIGMLTSNSVSQAAQIGSTITDAFKDISRVVELARAAYVENPLFGTDSAVGKFFDLNEVVEHAARTYAIPDSRSEMRDIQREIQGLRADQASTAKEERRARAEQVAYDRRWNRCTLWLMTLSIVVQVYGVYEAHKPEKHEETPPAKQQQSSPPPVKLDSDDVGPCP
jgi:hypothetical protein